MFVISTILLCYIQTQICCTLVQITIPKIIMNDRRLIPAVCLSTWLGFNRSTSVPYNSNGNETRESIERAIDRGVRHFEATPLYGATIMKQLNDAITNRIRSGIVRRKDLFLTIKLPSRNVHYLDLLEFIKSQTIGQIRYFDLFLLHWPFEEMPMLRSDDDSKSTYDYLTTWKLMIVARETGVARSIGVSNFNQSQIERLIFYTDIKPAVVQIEVNINGNNRDMIQYCSDRNITVMGYALIGSLFNPTVSPVFPPPRAEHPKLVGIAKKHNKSVAQVVLRYYLQLGVLPMIRTRNEAHLIEDIDIFDFHLSKNEADLIKKFDIGLKLYAQLNYSNKKYYPYIRYKNNLRRIAEIASRWYIDHKKGVLFPKNYSLIYNVPL